MKYTVEVKNPCRCFLRSGLGEREHFASVEEAKIHAEAMVEQMLRDFCKKHDFVLIQSGFTYTINTVLSR